MKGMAFVTNTITEQLYFVNHSISFQMKRNKEENGFQINLSRFVDDPFQNTHTPKCYSIVVD